MSSKQLTSFSDFRVDDNTDFLTAERYVQYLNDYCTHFGLWPHMNFSCLITSLKKGQNGAHVLVYTSNGQQHAWECDAVAVCSGLHVEPSIPRLEGIERVPVVLHSSEFKSREQFGAEKTVLILGSGETSSDLSYLAVTSPTKRVVVCHRNGFHLAPKVRPPTTFSGGASSPWLLISLYLRLLAVDEPEPAVDIQPSAQRKGEAPGAHRRLARQSLRYGVRPSVAEKQQHPLEVLRPIPAVDPPDLLGHDTWLRSVDRWQAGWVDRS